MRQILDSPELKARIMPSSEFLLGYSLQAFDENNQLVDAEKVEQLDRIFDDFLLFISITSQLMTAHAANIKEAENFSWDKK